MNSKLKYPLDLALTKIRARFFNKLISVAPVGFGKFMWEFENDSLTEVKIGLKQGPRGSAVYQDPNFVNQVNEVLQNFDGISFDGKIIKID